MQCRHARPRVDDYVGGTLNPEEASIVREHVDSCPSCRQDLEAAIALHQAFRRLRLRNEQAALSESEVDRIARRAILSPAPAPTWPWIVSIAASLVLGVGLALSLARPRERVVEVVREVRVPAPSPTLPAGFTWMNPDDVGFVEPEFIRMYNEFKRLQGRPMLREVSTNPLH